MATKDSDTVPASSNSIESSAERPHLEVVDDDLVDPDVAEEARPLDGDLLGAVGDDVDAVVAARLQRVVALGVERAGGQVDRRQVGAVRRDPSARRSRARCVRFCGRAPASVASASAERGRGRRWRRSLIIAFLLLSLRSVPARPPRPRAARPTGIDFTTSSLSTSITETSLEMPLVVKSSFSSGVKASCQTRWPTSR